MSDRSAVTEPLPLQDGFSIRRLRFFNMTLETIHVGKLAAHHIGAMSITNFQEGWIERQHRGTGLVKMALIPRTHRQCELHHQKAKSIATLFQECAPFLRVHPSPLRVLRA